MHFAWHSRPGCGGSAGAPAGPPAEVAPPVTQAHPPRRRWLRGNMLMVITTAVMVRTSANLQLTTPDPAAVPPLAALAPAIERVSAPWKFMDFADMHAGIG